MALAILTICSGTPVKFLGASKPYSAAPQKPVTDARAWDASGAVGQHERKRAAGARARILSQSERFGSARRTVQRPEHSPRRGPPRAAAAWLSLRRAARRAGAWWRYKLYLHVGTRYLSTYY